MKRDYAKHQAELLEEMERIRAAAARAQERQGPRGAVVLRAGPTFTVVNSESGPSIKCHRCGLVSSNWNDIDKLYCGNCHRFHKEVS